MNNNFIGSYVNDMRDVLVASALSNTHAIILSAPGWGKTAVAVDLASRISLNGSGDDHWSFTRLDPSSPPEVIRGVYDPAKLLKDPPEIELVRKGTPYQEGNRIAVLDEIFRASDPVFDMFVDLLNRQDVPRNEQAVVWATANFVINGTRLDALKDRFASWLWINPSMTDTEAFSDTFLDSLDQDLQVSGEIPDWQTVQEVREAKPGKNAKYAIKQFLGFAAEHVASEGYAIHPRRFEQWHQLVYRTSVYHTGEADFSSIPGSAKSVLRFAWPFSNLEDSKKWQAIMHDISDPLGATIDTILEEAHARMKRIQKDNNMQARTANIGELSKVIRDAQDSLAAFSGDPRSKETLQLLQTLFAKVAAGEDIPSLSKLKKEMNKDG